MSQFKPTLAVNADEATLRHLLDGNKYLLASPKYDGIRALRRGGELVSRSLRPTPNRHIRALLSEPLLEGFDGELIVGPPRGEGVFARSTSGVSRESGEPDFAWHVFDLWDHPGDFSHRYAALRARHAGLEGLLRSRVVLVPQVRVETPEDLAGFEERCVGEGYEGAMLRRPDAPYKRGRSTLSEGYLLKVKRFEDREGTVVGFEELMGNENAATTGLLGQTERSHRREGMVPRGTLGALRVRDPRFSDEFGVGSGFDAEQRGRIWGARATYLGAAVRYKYQPVGSTPERPRQPIFLGFRSPFDMDA